MHFNNHWLPYSNHLPTIANKQVKLSVHLIPFKTLLNPIIIDKIVLKPDLNFNKVPDLTSQ
jgi:hypothetical protein